MQSKAFLSGYMQKLSGLDLPPQLQAARKRWKERGRMAREMAGKTDEVIAQQ